MSPAFQIYLALSFDFESLLPILFFVLYGLSQFLGSKKKPKELEEPEEDESDAFEEARERARQIREEIQRKIRERQQGGAGGQGAGDWESPPVVIPPPARTILVETDAMLERSLPRVEPASSPKESYQNSLQSEMERRLEEQRAILMQARRKNEEARREARRQSEAILAKARSDRKLAQDARRDRNAAVSVPLTESFRGELVSELRNPQSVRKAILYREILGAPLGLR